MAVIHRRGAEAESAVPQLCLGGSPAPGWLPLPCMELTARLDVLCRLRELAQVTQAGTLLVCLAQGHWFLGTELGWGLQSGGP